MVDYSPALRTKALALSKEIGVSAAAKKLKISRSALTVWRRNEAPSSNGTEVVATPIIRTRFEERQRAVEISNKIGGKAAAAELGIPIDRLYRWRSEMVKRSSRKEQKGQKESSNPWIEGFRIGFKEGLAAGREMK
jgi:hypothetical protein